MVNLWMSWGDRIRIGSGSADATWPSRIVSVRGGSRFLQNVSVSAASHSSRGSIRYHGAIAIDSLNSHPPHGSQIAMWGAGRVISVDRIAGPSRPACRALLLSPLSRPALRTRHVRQIKPYYAVLLPPKRLLSTSAAAPRPDPSPSSPSPTKHPAESPAYDRLRPIIDSFEAPVEWAVAYGSGVFAQANQKPGEVSKLLK